MFTLKLFKSRNGQRITSVHEVHNVESMEIGSQKAMIELWVFKGPRPSDYDVFFVGESDPEMNAVTDSNHYGWGLLENSSGKTTEHYRPSGYGV